MAAHEEQLRRLALHDETLIESVLAMRLRRASPDAAPRLHPKTQALVRLAALLALGAAPVSYQWGVEAALDADATAEEILGTMIAVAPISGVARVVQATPDIAIQLGYDLDAAFEELDCGVHPALPP
ncbi:MAG TPA: carboxymuconolactone decarboxylase family protein [Actinomycetota bacterium]|jgi:alkylhydroperoxidase/carboxymuconolactone decarboxylase family protein YurZ|nr:carboxymuconolactone decarboxylase family protein [Actinomycetota bacterium]